MNRVLTLLRTPAIVLERFDHAPGVAHRDPDVESARSHAISFVEAGAFDLRIDGGAWSEATASTVFVATPGLPFSCRHEDEHPRDRCLSVRFSEEAAEGLRAHAAAAEAGVRGLSNRAAYLKVRLERAAGAADAALAEALAGELHHSLAAAPGRRPFSPHRLAAQAARVARVRELIDTRYAEPLSLSQMAAEAGMSLYHFARVFREMEGRPAHACLRDRRLAAAEARLRDGASVTDTCFAVGFGSLSHFVTAFRRYHGRRPSDVARGRRSPAR